MMDTTAFSLQFNGRKKLSTLRKRTMYIYGMFLILIGLYGLYNSAFEINQFVYILIIVGILKMVHGFYGKKLIKEKNSIAINAEEIEYKNSFQESIKIPMKDLQDLRIETANVQFVHADQSVASYDFSVFQNKELDAIYTELEKLKVTLLR